MKISRHVNKIILIIVLGLCTFLTFQFAIQCLFSEKKAKAMNTAFTKVNHLEDKEQKRMQQNILSDWGNPENAEADKVIALQGVYHKMPITDAEGEFWYYLTGDVFLQLENSSIFHKNAKIHLLLNGYAIDGNFMMQMTNAKASLYLYDSIPEKTGDIYRRNPLTKHYYVYNNGQYNSYTNIVPNGREETAMPTFTENSYISIEGSRIGANTLTAQNQSTNQKNSICLQIGAKKLHAYGINIIGQKNAGKNIALINTCCKKAPECLLFQCNIIGNIIDSENVGAVKLAGNTQIISSNIWGNKTNEKNFGVKVGSCKYNDLIVCNNKNVKFIASNIGTVTCRKDKQWVIYYVKDKDFVLQDGMVHIKAARLHEDNNELTAQIEKSETNVCMLRSGNRQCNGRDKKMALYALEQPVDSIDDFLFPNIEQNTVPQPDAMPEIDSTPNPVPMPRPDSTPTPRPQQNTDSKPMPRPQPNADSTPIPTPRTDNVIPEVILNGGQFEQTNGIVDRIIIKSGEYRTNGITANNWIVEGGKLIQDSTNLPLITLNGGQFTQESGTATKIVVQTGTYNTANINANSWEVVGGTLTQNSDLAEVILNGGTFTQTSGTLTKAIVQSGTYTTAGIHANSWEVATGGTLTQNSDVAEVILHGGQFSQTSGTLTRAVIRAGEYTTSGITAATWEVAAGKLTQNSETLTEVILSGGQFAQQSGTVTRVVVQSGTYTTTGIHANSWEVATGGTLTQNSDVAEVVLNGGTFTYTSGTLTKAIVQSGTYTTNGIRTDRWEVAGGTLTQNSDLALVVLRGGTFTQSSGALTKAIVQSGEYTTNGITAATWEVENGGQLTQNSETVALVSLRGGRFLQTSGKATKIEIYEGNYTTNGINADTWEVIGGKLTQNSVSLREVEINGGEFIQEENSNVDILKLKQGEWSTKEVLSYSANLEIAGAKMLHTGTIEEIAISAGELEVLAGASISNHLQVTGGIVIVHNDGFVAAIDCNHGTVELQNYAIVNDDKLQVTGTGILIDNRIQKQTRQHKKMFIFFCIAIIIIVCVIIFMIFSFIRRKRYKK